MDVHHRGAFNQQGPRAQQPPNRGGRNAHGRNVGNPRQGRGFVRGRGQMVRAAPGREERRNMPNAGSFSDAIPPIQYQALKNMVEDDTMEGSQIILRLSSDQSGFSRRLRQDMDGGMIQMILKVIGKICREETPPPSFVGVLHNILKSGLSDKLIRFLHGLIKEEASRRRHAPTHVSNCLDLLKAWVSRIPTTSEVEVSMLLTNIKHVVSKLDIGLTQDIALRIDEISEILEELEQRYKPKVQQEDDGHKLMKMHKEAPPNNFREISVFPAMGDIHGTENAYVRTNLVNSGYSNLQHYLDVQFRLLREDFVRPLREGIQYCFTASDELRLKKQKQHNVKVYENVSIEYPLPGNKGILYCIHFNTNRLQRVKWETSRRLMFGNLVCLSADKFKEHFLFATIADRDPRKLKMGFVALEFVCNNGQVGAQIQGRIRDALREEHGDDLFDSDEDIDSDEDANEEEPNQEERLAEVSGNTLVSEQDIRKKYYMVETDAYFEAYRYVLSGLQKIEALPLDRYIVSCNKDMKAPFYIRVPVTPVVYDFTSILKDNGIGCSKTRVEVMKPETWPSAEELQLDPSQVAALKSAVLNELSVIQGPPGTGKTHVGLVLMKLLLANRDLRRAVREIPGRIRTSRSIEYSQILVVCYTNHALDQFLEGVSEFHQNGIIRVGGRCKTKSLEKFTLSFIRRNQHRYSKSTFHKRHTVWQLRRDMEAQRDYIAHHTDVLEVSTHSIVSLDKLRAVIPQQMYDQLTVSHFKGNESLLQWLGVAGAENALSDKQYIVQETVKVIATPLEAMGFQYIHITTAITATGSLDQGTLINWMVLHPDAVSDKIEPPDPDTVYAFLDQFEIPFNFRNEHFNGIHEIEIKCGLLATGFDRPNPHFIKNWIMDRRLEEKRTRDSASGNSVESITEGLNAMKIQDDDIVFLEEQRNVDQGFMDDDNEGANEKDDRSGRNAEAMKKIEKELAAATYDQIKDGGWQLQPEERKRRRRKIKDQIGRVDAMPKRAANNVTDIFQLDENNRWKLYRRWVQDLRDSLRGQILVESMRYNELAKALSDARNELDLEILQSADVVAMTTSGAARYRDMVKRLPAKIVVVEEAAEVLEAHIVTSMPQSTQHLILIGDHQQLKPSPTVYELAKKFNLDVSLFERMIKNGIPHCRLALQHRMRPRIADLLRPHIYENLRDHESVMTYDDVIGVRDNIFFLSHEYEEDDVQDGMSKINRHEASFLVAFCQYLLQQGYAAEKITILTAYVGQLHTINRMRRGLERMRNVRVTAIDNFQGEENDIILLSLVRSNEEGKIGFLSIENRVCVALSRAKMGFYCIGNSTLLKEKSGLWRTILSRLERDGLSGDNIPLQCKNHPQDVAMVKTDKDFQKVPEGGCGRPCQTRLPCGHVCTRSCHPDDANHKLFVCRKSCERKCVNGHKCKLRCHQQCKCQVVVKKLVPKCGHEQNMPCHQEPAKFSCRVPCPDILECGHRCKGICGEGCHRHCYVEVEVKPACGHPPVNVACCRSKKLKKTDCREPCNITLKCGHICKGNCYQCKQGRLHERCQQQCKRVLFCGHLCRESCSSKCPPCNSACETQCSHSKCNKKCFESCVLCKEKCTSRFGNKRCSKLCSEPCDHEPNNEPCRTFLRCGHRCIGLMDETCPTLCRICNKDDVTEIFLGNEDEKNALFVQLECGHVFTYIDLDKWMKIENNDTSDTTSVQLKECPRCKVVIRKSKRYQHIINRQLMLINEVKEKINGNPEDIEAAQQDLTFSLKRTKNRKIVNLMKKQTHPKVPSEWNMIGTALSEAKTMNELAVVETRYRCLSKLYQIRVVIEEISFESLDTLMLEREVLLDIKSLRDWLFQPRAYFSDQELEDFDWELKRLLQAQLLCKVEEKCQKLKLKETENEDLFGFINKAKQLLLHPPGRFETLQKDVEELMKKIDDAVPDLVPGMGITFEERNMIVKAMSFGKGHWYKCPNGHVYCIGDCGGANQQGNCPECKTTIGGVGHRLAEGNQLAGVMDGATRPAYDPDNFVIPPEVFLN